MPTLSLQYSRQAFETSDDVAALCEELAAILAIRMQEAPSVQNEVKALLGELRSLGHQLCAWDSDGGEWEAWGGDFVSPEKTRIVVEFN